MGSTKSVPSENDKVKMKALIEFIVRHDANNVRNILSDKNNKRFYFLHNGLPIYHWIVLYSIFYSRDKLKELCEAIYEHRSKLGPIKKLDSKTIECVQFARSDAIQVLKSNANASYDIYLHDSKTAANLDTKDIFKINKVDPIAFCYSLKSGFIPLIKGEDNLDLVLDMLNRIKGEQKNKNYKPSGNNLCLVCSTEEKTMMIRKCNHIVTCKDCLSTIKECPVCRSKIESAERVYIS